MFYSVNQYPETLISRFQRITREESCIIAIVFNAPAQDFTWEAHPSGPRRERYDAFAFRISMTGAHCAQDYDNAFRIMQNSPDFESLVNKVSLANRDFQESKRLGAKLVGLLRSSLVATTVA